MSEMHESSAEIALIGRYFDGSTTPAELSQLAVAIADDPRLAAEFVRAGRMDACLTSHFEGARERSAARVEIADLLRKRAHEDQVAARNSTVLCAARAGVASKWFRWTGAAAAAAIVLAFAGSKLPTGSSVDDRVVGNGRAGAVLPEPAFRIPGWETHELPPAAIPAREVKRKLSVFYLPTLHVDPQPIDSALDLLADELVDVAARHRDGVARTIDLRITEDLEQSDARRIHPVSLRTGSVSAANALQLLAGQAGLQVAYVEGGVELRPRASLEQPLRSRSFDVPGDFFQRVTAAIAGEGSEANPLAMLSYRTPPGASAILNPDPAAGVAKLTVRATSEDLRSIATLADILQPAGHTDVEIATTVIDLPESAIAELFAAAAKMDGAAADLLSEIARLHPSDQIIADRNVYGSLRAALDELAEPEVVSMPKVVTGLDQEVTIASHTQRSQQREVNWTDSYDPISFIPSELIATGTVEDSRPWIETREDHTIQADTMSVAEVQGYLGGAGLQQAAQAEWYASELAAGSEVTVQVELMDLGASVADDYRELVFRLSEEEPDQGRELLEAVVEAGLANSFIRLTDGSPVSEGAGLVAPMEHEIGVNTLSFTLPQEQHYRDWVIQELNTQPAAKNPGYSARLTASLDGESVRVSGTVGYTVEAADMLRWSVLGRQTYNYQEDTEPLVDNTATTTDVDHNGDLDLQLVNTPHLNPQSTDTSEIDFDAVIAPGQTLMLELDGQDGGKQLVFMTAKKR